MPGFNGMGPRGEGAMTGGGRGYCAVPAGTGRSFGFGSGAGRGFGRGVGRGFGRGYGRGVGFRGNAVDYAYDMPAITPQQEAEMLKSQVQAMQSEVNAINKRLEELKSGTEE